MLSDSSGFSQELQISRGPPGACVPVCQPTPCPGSSSTRAVQGNSTVCGSHSRTGPSPANPPWLQTSWTRAASWQHALSRVQSDLMLHHSRGVTQEELGLTLSGGGWFGHPPHYCLPSPLTPRWLVPRGGAFLRSLLVAKALP